MPAYTLYDARASYEIDPNWEVAVNANNVTHKRYTCCEVAICRYGDERQLVSSVTYRWSPPRLTGPAATRNLDHARSRYRRHRSHAPDQGASPWARRCRMHHALLTRQQGAVRILVNNNPDVRNAITQGLYNGCHAP